MLNCIHSLKRRLCHLRDLRLLRRLDPQDRELIDRILSQRLTYLDAGRLISLMNSCRALEGENVQGIVVEAGCALGGSSILLASTKEKSRPFFVYDVFGMIPPPTKEDTPDVHQRYQEIASGKSRGLGGDTYYGYQENLYETVTRNLRRFGIDPEDDNVTLIKGFLQDTMKIDQPVALAHVDVDWYEPVMTCLQRITPHLARGGSIILDDYRSWGGCKKATDEFLAQTSERFARDDSARSLKLTKISE